MEKKTIRFGGTEVKFRRGSNLLKIVVLAVAVLSTLALLSMRGAMLEAKAQTEALRSQAQELEQQTSRLEQDIEDLNSIQGILGIAQEKLGLVDPDTVIFEPND